MSKLTVTESEKLVPVGKSTIYSDMETGKLSFEINARGHKVIDSAELDRVYGLRKFPNMNGNENGNHPGDLENAGNGIGKSRKELKTVGNADDSTGDAAFLTHEVERLKQELEAAGKREAKLLERETKLEVREEKLLDMLAIEQERLRC